MIALGLFLTGLGMFIVAVRGQDGAKDMIAVGGYTVLGVAGPILMAAAGVIVLWQRVL